MAQGHVEQRSSKTLAYFGLGNTALLGKPAASLSIHGGFTFFPVVIVLLSLTQIVLGIRSP